MRLFYSICVALSLLSVASAAFAFTPSEQRELEQVRTYVRQGELKNPQPTPPAKPIGQDLSPTMIYGLVSQIVSIPFAFALEARRRKRFPNTKPYTWGYYFGCSCVGWFPVALLATTWGWTTGSAEAAPIAVWLLAFSVSGIFIIRRRRWAWISGTILCFNPVFYWVHYAYAKNRWAELKAGESEDAIVPHEAGEPRVKFGSNRFATNAFMKRPIFSVCVAGITGGLGAAFLAAALYEPAGFETPQRGLSPLATGVGTSILIVTAGLLAKAYRDFLKQNSSPSANAQPASATGTLPRVEAAQASAPMTQGIGTLRTTDSLGETISQQ